MANYIDAADEVFQLGEDEGFAPPTIKRGRIDLWARRPKLKSFNALTPFAA